MTGLYSPSRPTTVQMFFPLRDCGMQCASSKLKEKYPVDIVESVGAYERGTSVSTAEEMSDASNGSVIEV